MPTSVRSILVLGAVVLLGACSSSGSTSREAPSTTPPAASTTVPPPAGPKAAIAPLTGGAGINLVAAGEAADIDLDALEPSEISAALSEQMAERLDAVGWIQEEFSASGTASAYAGEVPADGLFDLKPTTTADYTTRIVVRRPADADAFNGTVVVEWLNVSGGLDASPDWTYTEDELIRSGYAWVGVSAQQIGVEGGDVAVSTPVSDLAGAGTGLVELDPERYGDLHHPGDAYAYDIFTQVGRALRLPGETDPLGGLTAQHLLAVGESQSGYMLTTYVNGIQPLSPTFDGFLIHSRGGAAAPLGEPGKGIGIAGSIGGTPTTVRTDGAAPVLVVETESDVLGVLGYLPARQEDTATFRLWEIAGTAHVDRYQLGIIADSFGCTNPVNDGPHHFVVAAALDALNTWVVEGTAPPEAPRLDVVDDAYVTDADGIVTGGIRTPLVDVPVDRLSGTASEGGSVACLLAGETVPLSPERIAARYSSVEDYLEQFEASADAAIDAGFVLAADRDALLDTAQPGRLAG